MDEVEDLDDLSTILLSWMMRKLDYCRGLRPLMDEAEADFHPRNETFMDEEVKLDDLFTSQLFMDDDEVVSLSSVLGNFQFKKICSVQFFKKLIRIASVIYLFIFI
jgi:hypothetical protein